MCRHAGLMLLLGRLLLFQHEHVVLPRRNTNTDDASNALFAPGTDEKIKSYAFSQVNHTSNTTVANAIQLQSTELGTQESHKCSVDGSHIPALRTCMNQIREDAFVILTQLSCVLDLFTHEREIALAIIAPLLHWSICKVIAPMQFKIIFKIIFRHQKHEICYCPANTVHKNML
jgi:hypothetical protein